MAMGITALALACSTSEDPAAVTQEGEDSGIIDNDATKPSNTDAKNDSKMVQDGPGADTISPYDSPNDNTMVQDSIFSDVVDWDSLSSCTSSNQCGNMVCYALNGCGNPGFCTPLNQFSFACGGDGGLFSLQACGCDGQTYADICAVRAAGQVLKKVLLLGGSCN